MTDMIAWMVSSSVLILLVMVLRRLLRGRISLRLQYALWLLVLARLLIPGTVGESAISVQGPLNTAEARISETPLPDNWAVVVVQPGEEVQTFPDGGTSVSPPVEPGSGTSTSPPSTVGTLLQPMGFLLKHLWYAGMAVTGLLLLVSNLAFYRRLRRSRSRIETDASTKVYVTNAIQSPCLFGVPFPAIYVPAAVAEEPEALGHVLAHELSHRRHGDHIWTALRGVCLVLHWYNPLVWWAAALSRRDCELACDEAAVKRLGEAQRAAYGRTLVGLAERRSGLMRCATSMSGSDLKERIAALVARPATRRTAAVVLVLAVAVFAVCAFTGPRPREDPADTDASSDEAAVTATGIEAMAKEFLSCVREQGATVQMRTAPDGPDYTACTVDAQWVERNILDLFDNYDTGEDTYTTLSGEAEDDGPAEGLYLQLDTPGFTIQIGADDVVRFLYSGETAEWTARYRDEEDGIADSILTACRAGYDELLMGDLRDQSVTATENAAAEAVELLWQNWLALMYYRQVPGSQWEITGYRVGDSVTGMVTAEDDKWPGELRATWELDILVRPADYDNTAWQIGNAVNAEEAYGADYQDWLVLTYQGWLIRNGESGFCSIPDYGTGAYTIEDLLVTYPLPVEAGDVIHSFPYEANLGTEDGAWGVAQAIPEALTAYIPAGAEVTGYGAVPIADWATFTLGDTSYTLLAREGYPSGNWLDILVDWKGLDTEDVIYDRLSTSGLVDFYTSDQDTGAASWKWEDVTYVLETAGQTDAVEKLEALLAWCPEPLLGTSTSSSEEEAAVYVYEKEGFGGPFTIALYPDGTFQYYEGYLSSYIGFGTWEMDGNLLTLREHDYGLVNHFTITQEGLVFQAEGSDNFPYEEVADGERFLESAPETEAAEASA